MWEESQEVKEWDLPPTEAEASMFLAEDHKRFHVAKAREGWEQAESQAVFLQRSLDFILQMVETHFDFF